MLRRIFLVPTRSQWDGWSLPSKVGLVSFYVGILGLFVSILPIISAPPPHERVTSELESINSRQDWSAMSKVLDGIANRDDMKDEYHYFKGRLCIYNPTCFEGAEFFLSKIAPSSLYFQRATASLVLLARRSNAHQQQSDALRSEFRRIADELIRPKTIIPLYYFVKLMSMNEMSYAEVDGLFDEFIGRYESVFNFTNYPLVMYSGEGGVVRVDWAFDVLAVLALFEAKLAIAAHNNNLSDKKIEAIRNWKKLYTKEAGAPLIIRANTRFPARSTRLEIVDTNDIARRYADWSYGDLYDNLAKTISLIEKPEERRQAHVLP